MRGSQLAHTSKPPWNSATPQTATYTEEHEKEVREERFPWGLGVILVLVIVGGVGFWLGSSSVAPVVVPVAAPVVPAPAPVAPVYPTYAPHGGGFPLIPLIFGLIFLAVIFKFVRHAAWSANQRGAWPAGGPGGPWTYGGSRGRHGHGRAWYGHGWDADDQSGQRFTGTTAGQTPEESQTTRPPKARDFWNRREVPPMVDEMFQRWHSRMHADTTSAPDAESASNETNEAGSLTLPPKEPSADQPNDPPTGASA
jgi:hypothetical protein